MRRNQITFIAIMCLCISYLTGCGSTGEKNVSPNDSIATEGAEATDEEVTGGADTAATDITKEAVATEAPAESITGWQVLESFEIKQKSNVIAFYNPDFGITAGYSGEIHYSYDQGETWPIAQNKTACLFGLDILNENVAFACGNQSNVTKTTDGGKTWNRVADFGGTSPNQCRMLSFIDENTGFIASDKKLAYTSDSGNTWTELTAPAKILAIYLASATKGYLVGTDKKLYVTNDSGATWEVQNPNIEGFENIIAMPLTCVFSLTEAGTGTFFYLEKGGVLHCFETTDGTASWSKSSVLNVAESVESSLFLNLSKDSQYLTIQSLDCKYAAIAAYVE